MINEAQYWLSGSLRNNHLMRDDHCFLNVNDLEIKKPLEIKRKEGRKIYLTGCLKFSDNPAVGVDKRFNCSLYWYKHETFPHY